MGARHDFSSKVLGGNKDIAKSTKSLLPNCTIAFCFLAQLCGCTETSQPQTTSGKTGHIIYARHDIKAGSSIADQDVDDKVVDLAKVPADAANLVSTVGAKAIESIGQGQIVSVRDIGKPLTESMLKRLIITTSVSTKEEMATVLVAAKDLDKGTMLTDSNILVTELPLSKIPMDAIADTKAVAGKAIKYELLKG